MNNKLLLAGLGALSIAIAACHGPKKSTVVKKDVTVVTTESESATDAGEMQVNTAKKSSVALYRPSYTRRNDILHTALNVKFDWKKQHLLGEATIRIKPMFYPTDSLELDAKGFDIKKIALLQGGSETILKYTYDQAKLQIKLPREFKSSEEYTVFIAYTAKPNELPTGGSAAITSDKGLYFINPLGEDPGKPKQIWTQGETESNSKWFPTVDKPNERMTNEIYMTVENNYKTLSNGLLKDSKVNADGTRTDHWVMDMPHAPYLVMMTVGEFAIVEETWEGKPLMYYVEPKYAPYAKQIYTHCPEILTFFSDRLGVRYPWQKLAHVITREYVSGAMENTTAILYGDFCQKNGRELEDSPNDGIVAHEMFHHWFGDLVTAESWSNLSVNESFANYSEYLWFEHKYGKDRADSHLRTEREGYLMESKTKMHDLIDFTYADKEDMFDAHSYNKGGCILNMLRHYLGDDAFFAGLKTYLTDNAYSTGEAHQLRLALEKVTGEDLSWFFNQWYYSAGHPVLDISYDYVARLQTMNVTVKQTQDMSKCPVFKLPLDIDIYTSENPTRHTVWMTQSEQTFSFKVDSEPSLVNVDGDKMLLCEKNDSKSNAAYVYQYYHGKQYLDRYESLSALSSYQKADETIKTMFLDAALKDKSAEIRVMALTLAYIKKDDLQSIAKIANLAKVDVANTVRAAAFEKLGELGAKGYEAQAAATFDSEKSDAVIAGALNYIYAVNPEEALKYADKLKTSENSEIVMSVADMYATTGKTQYLPFFEANLRKFNGYTQFMMLTNYSKLLKNADETTITAGINNLAGMSKDKSVSIYGRLGATNAIKAIQKGYEDKKNNEKTQEDPTLVAALIAKIQAIQDIINEIKKQETDKILNQYYQNF